MREDRRVCRKTRASMSPQWNINYQRNDKMEVDELRVAKVAGQLHESITRRLTLLAHRSPHADLKALLSDIHQFQPCPQLLHSQLETYVAIILKAYLEDHTNSSLTEVFYTLAKIVGSKKTLNYFQTDVNLIPHLTQRFLSDPQPHWHEKYLLLCWLTVLSLAPFNLDTFQQDIKSQLREIGHNQLFHSGPLQPLGSRLLGSLVMRSDCNDLRQKFLDEVLHDFDAMSVVGKQGLLASLNVALHKDPTMTILESTVPIVDFLTSGVGQEDDNTDLSAKILSKLSSYLIELDDMDKLEEVVEWFELQFSHKNTDTRFILARQYSKMLTRIDECLATDIILDLLHNTKDLSYQPFDAINSDKLHTYLLTLAELLRLDLVDRHGFDTVVGIVHRTFFFQQARITHIAGSNIRDASNFIAWSLAKYQKQALEPRITTAVFTDLLLVCCFDKEIMIRRSATAALQELVGRHGSEAWAQSYPEDEKNAARSIRVIEVLDYIDIGSSVKSYLSIPQKLIEFFPNLKPKFVSFLVENVYNIDNELAQLSSKALKVLITNETELYRDQTISQIIFKASKKPINSFIGLSETIPLIHDLTILNGVLPVFNNTKINHHRDPPFVVMAYLSILNALLDIDVSLPENVLDNVFDAIRVDGPEIIHVVRQIAPKLVLSSEHWAKWLHYMKNNNLNTSSSVALLKDFKANVDEVVELLMVERTVASVKTAILGSISEYLTRGGVLREGVLRDIALQLDDYSISEQGDVGSRVRLAAVNLVELNSVFFNGELRTTVILKLLRLAAEPIDRLRHDSVILLQKFFECDEISTETRDLEEYFSQLLHFSVKHFPDDKDASLELLRGYIFSAGALKATDTLITASLHAFSALYLTLTPTQQSSILLQLAELIKVDPVLSKSNTFEAQRHNKQILVGMQFFTRLLQTNIPVPGDFNLRGLYVRVHNLHLATKNMTRLSCAIKIFGHLYSVHDLPEAKARLIWLMVNHPLARVRTLASEETYMVYAEKYEITMEARYKEALKVIEDVDWSGKNLKEYAMRVDV